MNPKTMEAWLTLMAEAMKGTNEAKEAFKLFPQTNAQPDVMQAWMSRFMNPSMATSPNEFSHWYEDWCRMMGVVPRSRYLELLERYDILRSRLEEAEEKIKHLQSMLGMQGQEEEAKKVLDLWGTTLEKTLQAQTDWMKAWTATQPPQSDEKTEEKTDEKPPSSEG